jgi:FlgN protein
MNDPLAELCNLMEQNVLHHQLLLALSRDQQRAIRAHDYEYLGAKAEDMRRLNRQAAAIDSAVERKLPETGHFLQLPDDAPTFCAILQAAPEPWASQLAQFQQEMRTIYTDLLQVARTSVESMQRAALAIDESMHAFMACVDTPSALLNVPAAPPQAHVLADRN